MIALAQLLSTLISIYSLCVIAWMILTLLVSFNVVNRQQRAVMLSMYYLNRLCGPPLYWLRRRLPDTGQLDLTPVALLLLLDLARDVVVLLALGQNPAFALVAFVARIIQLFIYCLIAQIVVSLLIAFNIVNRYQRFVSAIAYALERICEPALAPIRRFLPPLGMIDLSPMVLILLLGFLQGALMRLMFQL